MDELNELSDYDFPDTEWVPNGYDMTQIPKNTTKNFNKLVEEHNKLVRVVNELLMRSGEIK